MIDGTPRLLFVPVSGPFGMGEYARSLAIAKGAHRRWPSASIHFILSGKAPYAVQTPFSATLLASSPTFHSKAVIDVIEQWRPDVVIFDNAGRTAQLRAAKRYGAGVVYISARRRQRSRAFRLSWMRLIDEHWIAYPEFIAGSLSFLERLKLDLLRRPAVRYLDVILESTASRVDCAADDYVLVVPGGGTGHPGANDAVEYFLSAAKSLAATGVATVFVGRAAETPAGTPPAPGIHTLVPAASEPAEATHDPHLRQLGSLPQSELVELMRGARLIIANGGSTLLQSIACGKPCIAVPIAGDQGERIRRCVSAGVAVAAALDSASIVRAAGDLLQNESRLDALVGRTIALGLTDGVDVALRALNALMAKGA